MSALAAKEARAKVIYPESDGLPMADNTKQFRWIVTIQGGLDGLYRHDPEVFVAGNLLWYPIEGDNTIRVAPDIMVVFGRPKGDRGSYLQWLEEHIAPQVVFEVLSPGNRAAKLISKFKFYERYGVEEYYIYDPDGVELSGWLRGDGELRAIPEMNGWVSPRLKIRFALEGAELSLYAPDGKRFASYVELVEQREQAQAQLEHTQTQLEHAQTQLEHSRQRTERLAAQIKALGGEPEA